MNDSFIFYRSFAESLRRTDEKTAYKTMMAIFDFVFDEAEPKLDGVADIMFTLMRPQLEANIKRRKNGMRGGRYSKVNDTEIEKTKKNFGYENEKPLVTNKKTKKIFGYESEEPNDNVNANVNVNDNVNVNVKGGSRGEKIFPPPATPENKFDVFDSCQTNATSKNELPENAQSSSKTEKFYSKKTYGSAKNVFLTDEQHASLTAKYGEKLPAMVEYLSNYIAAHGKKYKDHNRVLRDWVEAAVRRKQLEKQELDRREQRLHTGELRPKSAKNQQSESLEDSMINELANMLGEGDPEVVELRKKEKLGTLTADDFTKWYRIDDPAILKLREKERLAANG